jgi:hypothetical protein
MFKKDVQARRKFSVLLSIFVAVTVFLLSRSLSVKKASLAATGKANARAAASASSDAAANADAQANAAGSLASVARPVKQAYRFETRFAPGQPATIAPRFSTPSAAEATIRSARLAELIDGSLASLRQGDTVQLPLPDNRVVEGQVALVQHEANGHILVGGQLTGGIKGSFSLGEDESRLGGMVLPTEGTVGYLIETGTDGAAYLLEKNKGAIVCMELPVVIISHAVVRDAKQAAADSHVIAGAEALLEVSAQGATPEYSLSSRPSAPAVAYLDFDGENVTDVNWNGGSVINASASGMTADQITEIWRRVSEDYRPFNIDVTTNRSRYDNAPAGSRIRCVVTQTSSWYGSAGGVAYIGSWGSAGGGGLTSTTPCWVFANMLSSNARYIAEACSHEIGHTLGLSHDGLKSASGGTTTAYYTGNGTGATSWAPIMGTGYYNSVVQWSKGDYGVNTNVGNNNEDDLAIISDSRNHGGYMADDAGGTIASAATLGVSGSTVSTVGIVERTGDVDIYKFTTAGGSVTFTLVPEFSSLNGLTNLDAQATLYNASGSVVADANPTGSLFPSITTTLSAGTYYLSIKGVGEGVTPGVGYTNYGSIGRYEITGTVVASVAQPPSITSASSANAVVGSAFSHQVTASNSPTSYSASGLPSGVSINASTGLISGTISGSAGVYTVSLSAANSSGSGSQTFKITVTAPMPAAPSITSASSKSAVIGSSFSHQVTATNSPTSFSATGLPSGLSINGTSGLISGTVLSSATAGVYSVAIKATNAGGTGSQTFSLTLTSPVPPAPVISSPTSSSNVRGSSFSYQITATNTPTSYSASGLPSGLSINTSTGLISGTVSSSLSAGIYSVTITATNAGGSSTKTLLLTLSLPALPLPIITSVSSIRVVLGVTVSHQVVGTNSPTLYLAVGLPAGISLNSSNGILSGAALTTVSPGLYVATITVANSSGIATQLLTLDVKSAFAAWAQDQQIGDINSASAADPDGDGAGNLLEYAFDRSPSSPDNAAMTETSMVNVSGVPRMEISFVRPNNRPDLRYTVEVSSDMKTWAAGHAYGANVTNGSSLPTQEIEHVSLGSEGERIRVRDIGGTGQRFIRVKVTTL